MKVFMTALNGTTFLGMIRVDGPPEWASGEGRYVLEAEAKALLSFAEHRSWCAFYHELKPQACDCGLGAVLGTWK